MTRPFKRPTDLAAVAALARALPAGDQVTAAAAAARQHRLTKPHGSLGRLEEIAIWLARWQGRQPPTLDRVLTVVFAGNHGVAVHGISAFPIEVTHQMVENFAVGGAAINQLTRAAGSELVVVPLALDRPTRDFTVASAMDDGELMEALLAGWDSVTVPLDLLLVGEMGIGNTTAAAALCAALYGGGGVAWAGPGTGVDAEGVRRKAMVIDAACERHGGAFSDPLACLARVGGRELAAMVGAVLAARHQGVPVLLDGFVTTAAAAVLHRLSPDGLDHCLAAHASAEPAHVRLLASLGLDPLLRLGMRLGEASGAAVALAVARSALAAHTGMQSFDEARVAPPHGG